MSEFIPKRKEEFNIKDSPPAITPELNDDIYYNCSECFSHIEIISINEENNAIEFICLNEANNHPKKINMSLKEYLKKMKKYNSSKLNKDTCEKHKSKYVSYCFNCSCHLCKECLKKRNHLNHVKNNIIEIQPMNEELNIVKHVIKDYEGKIKYLMETKIKIINKLMGILNENKNYENIKNKENCIKNEESKKSELKINRNKYIEDINEIIKKYKNDINIRKKKYITDKNIIINKYKLLNQKEYIIHEYRISELEKKINEKIKNLKYDKLIENINNIRRINEIVLNTYDLYNNNYYNSININSILQSYMNNDYIKNKIMKNVLRNKYDEICEIIQQKKQEDNYLIKENIIMIQNMKNSNAELLKLLSEANKEKEQISIEYEDNLISNAEKYSNELENTKKNYEDKLKKQEMDFHNEIEKLKNEYETKTSKKEQESIENEITIIYKIKEEEKNIKIFDKDFVTMNKEFCKILYKGEEYPLQDYFNLENKPKNLKVLELKLKYTNKITSFYSMFYDCSSLLYLPDISNFDTSNITSMGDMFAGCISLSLLADISNWNTSKVKSFSEMFYGCTSLTFLPDISKWDTSNVIKMNKMFYNCSSLLYLPDISNWNMANVTKINKMFCNCSSLMSLPDLSKWNLNNVESKEDMFLGCDKSLNIPNIFQTSF